MKKFFSLTYRKIFKNRDNNDKNIQNVLSKSDNSLVMKKETEAVNDNSLSFEEMINQKQVISDVSIYLICNPSFINI